MNVIVCIAVALDDPELIITIYDRRRWSWRTTTVRRMPSPFSSRPFTHFDRGEQVEHLDLLRRAARRYCLDGTALVAAARAGLAAPDRLVTVEVGKSLLAKAA